MDYFVISAFLNTVTSAACCGFVLLSSPRSKITRTFSIFTFFVFLWSGFYFLWATSNNQTDALVLGRLINAAALFIPPSFFHFCCHLLNKYKDHSTLIRNVYIFNFLFLPLAFTPLYIDHAGPISMFPYWPFPGKLYFILVLEYATLIGYSLYMLVEEIKSSSGKECRKLKIIFFALAVGFLGGATNFLPSYRIPVIPFGNAFVMMYVLAVAYAIFKYQFMDIKITLKRSLVYTILITLITLFFCLLVYFAEHVIKEIVGYRSFFISIAAIAMIVLTFTPLKNLIQGILEKYLFRGSFVEITEENEMLRRQVTQTERLRSVAILASGMAHEIKNPLTALKTFSEYLPQKMDDKEFLKKFSPIISNEINRIDALVHELLDFARPAPVCLKPVNVHALLDNTLEFLSNDLIKHKIRVTKNYRLDPLLSVELDQNQFKQAFLNILLNSMEAMPGGGELSITTAFSAAPEYIAIKIQDTGTGINPEDLAHIFDPFFSKKDQGTGLGLSITHEIVRNHRGRIFVEGQSGKGTAFIIELPVLSPL